MSGVQSGTRLERLERLRAQVEHQITVERRRAADEGAARIRPPAPPPPREPKPFEVNRVDRRLRELGVTAREVKEWAVDAGLMLEVKRGRVSEALVEHFADSRDRLNELVRRES